MPQPEKEGAGSESRADTKLARRVYDDLVHPTAQTVGIKLDRAVQAALLPLDGVFWSVEHSFKWIGKTVKARLSAVGAQPDGVRRPPADIEAGVIAGIQTAGPHEDPIRRNLLAALLATCMSGDSSTVHPAFVEIVRQMSATEARILAVLGAKRGGVSIMRIRLTASWVISDASGVRRSSPEFSLPVSREWSVLADEIRAASEEEFDFAVRMLRRQDLVVSSSTNELPLGMFNPNVATGAAVLGCRDAIWEFSNNPPKAPLRSAGEWTPLVQVEVEDLCLTQLGDRIASASAASEFFSLNTREFRVPSWAS